jgi:putative hydrolase of the HAD superfamily
VLARALVSVGVSSERASELVEHARECYLDTAKWRLFDDTLPVLSRLLDSGWRHVILSNHVPELPDLVDQLGLGSLVEATVSSALTGYEKPHPEMFRLGRASAGEPDTIWMVGDNPAADVRGAEAVGIPAILVRRTPEELSGIVRHSPDLAGVARWL